MRGDDAKKSRLAPASGVLWGGGRVMKDGVLAYASREYGALGQGLEHLLVGVAADDRVLHVEVVEGEVEGGHLRHADAALGEVRGEPVVRHAPVRELLADAEDEVVLGVQEGEPARLLLLHHGDLDEPHHGQARR